LEWDEDKTRQLLIDTQLAQAGWDINDKESVDIEVEVKHQPSRRANQMETLLRAVPSQQPRRAESGVW
jgi:type I site-specific restriction endonuclease